MPFPIPTPPTLPQEDEAPNTVIGAKKVELALVTYRDERNVVQTQLAIVGENNINLLESRALGLTKNTTPQGPASSWLRDGIFKALGRVVKTEEKPEKKEKKS